MSLFDSLMLNDMEENIFAMHMRSMRQFNNIMNSMFTNNVNDMFRGLEAITGPPPGLSNQLVQQPRNHHGLMPFQFFDNLSPNRLLMGNMSDPGMASFSSSSFVSMTRGPDGRQQVYKATSSAKTGPGGICETKKTVEDSRTGVRKLAIGHHIGDRAHVIEKQRNEFTGEEEENVELINLDDDDAEDFDREFDQKARASDNRRYIGGPGGGRPQLAILPSTSTVVNNNPQLPSPQQITTRVHTAEEVMDGNSDNDDNNKDDEPTPIVTLVDDDDDDDEVQEITPTCNVTSVNYDSNTAFHIPPSNTSPSGNYSANRRIYRNVKVRRPLRTPSSSPLASNNSAAKSVHPHPYNSSNMRRQQHRAMKGQYHQQHNQGAQ